MLKIYCSNIVAKYKNVQKGVNDIIGGKVLEHEGITIGEARGEERGRREEKFDTARQLRNAGMSDKQIHQFTDLSLDDLRLL